MATLEETAKALVAPNKGILAADESTGTIEKRFKSIDVESTEENRRDYREMLFRTAGAEEFISGVILFDETIRQNAADGTPMREILSGKGIQPGMIITSINDEPIDMRDYVAEKSRVAAKKCTDELFVRLQAALDELGRGTHVKELKS